MRNVYNCSQNPCDSFGRIFPRMTTTMLYGYLSKCLWTTCVTKRMTALCICLRVPSMRNDQPNLCSATMTNRISRRKICFHLYENYNFHITRRTCNQCLHVNPLTLLCQSGWPQQNATSPLVLHRPQAFRNHCTHGSTWHECLELLASRQKALGFVQPSHAQEVGQRQAIPKKGRR